MEKRFTPVSLAFNLNVLDIGRPATINQDCNSGGSVICNPGTGGCGSGGMTCVGTSCSGASATKDLGFDAHILVEHGELQALQKELHSVVSRFAR